MHRFWGNTVINVKAISQQFSRNHSFRIADKPDNVPLTTYPQPFKMKWMRGVLLRSAVVLIMVAILGGHLTELFDRWDHTLRTGQDSDYAVVLIAACAGAAFIVAKSSRLMRRLIRLLAELVPCILLPVEVAPVALKTFAFDLSPPSTIAPIRI